MAIKIHVKIPSLLPSILGQSMALGAYLYGHWCFITAFPLTYCEKTVIQI